MRVTDRQTDGRTELRSQDHASIAALPGKNRVFLLVIMDIGSQLWNYLESHWV